VLFANSGKNTGKASGFNDCAGPCAGSGHVPAYIGHKLKHVKIGIIYRVGSMHTRLRMRISQQEDMVLRCRSYFSSSSNLFARLIYTYQALFFP
jgi:hypothetical protein